MDPNRRNGKPDEELFLQQAGQGPDTPTVGPLRINKQSPATPPPAIGNDYRTPPNPQNYPPPASLPPTAPLPYPNERLREQAEASRRAYTPIQEEKTSQARTATPEREQRRRPRTPQPSSGPRARFVGPNRPTVAGYGNARRPSEGSDRNEDSQSTGSSERREASPKPLPTSPGPEPPDKESFSESPTRGADHSEAAARPDQGTVPAEQDDKPYLSYTQQYWPPPSTRSYGSTPTLRIPNPRSVNRLSSTASTSTTKAQRGSPPPPETPAAEMPGGGIEARYAAAGIAGPATLNSLQAQQLQSAAAVQRANQYMATPARMAASPPADQTSQYPSPQPQYGSSSRPQPQEQTRVAWASPQQAQTPGQRRQYQSPSQRPFSYMPQSQEQHDERSRGGHAGLETDLQRLHIAEEPPPAYTSVGQPSQGYPTEKGRTASDTTSPQPQMNTLAGAALYANTQNHPAFANDPRPNESIQNDTRQVSGTPPAAGQPDGNSLHPRPSVSSHTGSTGSGRASPPPLPEGWIAHMDPISGQYYYIHLPTQSTQWEFPKGPTPLNFQEPMSPIGTFAPATLASPSVASFGQKALMSPGFSSPQQDAFRHGSMLTVASNGSAIAFQGPPPDAGVELYRVMPSNGVYFGPYLRYTNMDLERGLWLGSILLVTDAPQPPTIHIHQTSDLSPNPRQLKAHPIYIHRRFTFYRYDVDLRMDDDRGAKWTYAVTSHLGCTRYEFLVAGRYETSWRFVAHSGNDFALNVKMDERQRIGGVGYMWKDILQKHVECGGFHAQLGLGDQLYGDRLWKEIPSLRQWTALSGKENRRHAPWTAQHEEEVTHAYFHYYTSHFDQPHLREAFAQIPHVLSLDDHDIFDGYGSYPDYMQSSNMFKNIGRIGITMYLLFQHHTTHEILRNVHNDIDIFTVTGTGWHFVKYLGPAVVVVGPDCRSERTPNQVMAGPTWQGLFPKVALLPPSVQHCIWMVPVPIIYPRLEAAEQFAHTVATGKKAMTGTFNALGKVTSSVAGIVGAKGAVGEGFSSLKRAVGKTGLMSSVLNPFGEIDMLDELRDQWTHESKDLERTYFIRTLQGISHNKSLRMTFFSGEVNCCGAGLVHDPSRPSDHKTMYQIISSAVVNVPPPSYVLRLLHTNKALYVPPNGQRSAVNAVSDTKEDMLELFNQDVNGAAREMKKLMGRRNYVACVAYDPEIVSGMFAGQGGRLGGGGAGAGKLSLAVDFIVQNEGAYGQPLKYGPVVIPSLEYGR